MQIVKIFGGLGNQMFQVAFALAFYKKFKVEVLLYNQCHHETDTSGTVSRWKYSLNNFSIPFLFANDEQLNDCIREVSFGKSFLPKFIRNFLKKIKIASNKTSDKIATIYEPELMTLKDNTAFIGYFQSEKYFKDIRNDIHEMFRLQTPLNEQNQEMLNKIKNVNAVSLHVRRGDYVKLQDVHGLCTLDYYKRGISYIAEKVENPHFFLFSDDVTWVVENLKIDYPYTVVDINDIETGVFDIELMKNCKHNIIANSSFSWWGAWLNKNPNKIIVAPSKWFSSKELKYDDIIPENWVKL